MKWFSVQLSIAITLLVIATAGTWYEGSAIRDRSFEWAYSTPVSHMIHGEILNVRQISQLDHFVYAAKFHPFLPFMMIISALYIALLITYRIVQHDLKKWMMGLGLSAAVFIIAGSTLAGSPTAGGNLFFYFFIGSGVISLTGAILCLAVLNRSYTKEIIS
ncbi:DUF4306 domain-containing protein [Jeotgalibacillus malaysiensis]|uniref:DUF4306 domain-containing protein n=1 Tax=Jeotgalibacillus malaysiensis TaxID=1508404 RepID=UPI00384C8B79